MTITFPKLAITALALAGLAITCLRSDNLNKNNNSNSSSHNLRAGTRKLQIGFFPATIFGTSRPQTGTVTAVVTGGASLNGAAGSGGSLVGGGVNLSGSGGTSGVGQGTGMASSPYLESDVTASGVAGGDGTTTATLTSQGGGGTSTGSGNVVLDASATFGGTAGPAVLAGGGSGTGTITAAAIGTGTDVSIPVTGMTITSAGTATGNIYAGGQGVATSPFGTVGGQGSGIGSGVAGGSGSTINGDFNAVGNAASSFNNVGAAAFGQGGTSPISAFITKGAGSGGSSGPTLQTFP